jgi:hypothetical protein
MELDRLPECLSFGSLGGCLKTIGAFWRNTGHLTLAFPDHVS